VLTGLDGNVGFVGASFNTGVQIGSASNNSRFTAWGNVNLGINAGSNVNIGCPLTVGGLTTVGTVFANGPIFAFSGLNVTGNVAVSGGFLGAAQSTRANNSPGTAGQISTDANYIYVCTAANTWKRVALSTF